MDAGQPSTGQPSNGRIERLKKKLETRVQEWNERNDKIRRLRLTLAREPDPNIKFNLEKQIQEEEQQQGLLEQSITQLEMEIATLEQTREMPRTPSVSEHDNLYNALLHLNYFKQTSLFQKIVAKQRVAAFLIHGAPDHGQRWLLNRLLRNISLRPTDMVVRVAFARKARKFDIKTLWRELGGRVGLVGSHPPAEIAKQVYRCWQSHTVILIFDHVNNISKEHINEFIRDFWLPLANNVPMLAQPASDYRLFVFLIDHSGMMDRGNGAFAEATDPSENPSMPIRLGKIDRLSTQVLTRWIENRFDDLPATFTEQAEHIVQDIMVNTTNGVPEQVLEHICNKCGCNWYEREREWLKY